MQKTMNVIKELIDKYSKNSKHSSYQMLPKRLTKIIGSELSTRSRYEAERLCYILKKIKVTDKSILDIGGNTGFFTFELIEAGAKRVHYYEGNKDHADFVKLAAAFLNLHKKIQITNNYYSFEESGNKKYDIVVLLNVLHHIGDDYGVGHISIKEAKKTIINQLNSLWDNTDILIFQMGFNWQGNIEQCLFENGTKEEMINYIKEGVKYRWDILNIGIAESIKNGIAYFDLTNENIKRDDQLGEFLNRPLFILKKSAQS